MTEWRQSIAKLKSAAYALAAEQGHNKAIEALEALIQELKREQWDR